MAALSPAGNSKDRCNSSSKYLPPVLEEIPKNPVDTVIYPFIPWFAGFLCRISSPKNGQFGLLQDIPASSGMGTFPLFFPSVATVFTKKKQQSNCLKVSHLTFQVPSQRSNFCHFLGEEKNPKDFSFDIRTSWRLNQPIRKILVK